MSQPTDVAPRIAEELQLPLGFVRAALALLETGATVPFLARYRKEQTGGGSGLSRSVAMPLQATLRSLST